MKVTKEMIEAAMPAVADAPPLTETQMFGLASAMAPAFNPQVRVAA